MYSDLKIKAWSFDYAYNFEAAVLEWKFYSYCKWELIVSNSATNSPIPQVFFLSLEAIFYLSFWKNNESECAEGES